MDELGAGDPTETGLLHRYTAAAGEAVGRRVVDEARAVEAAQAAVGAEPHPSQVVLRDVVHDGLREALSDPERLDVAALRVGTERRAHEESEEDLAQHR